MGLQPESGSTVIEDDTSPNASSVGVGRKAWVGPAVTICLAASVLNFPCLLWGLQFGHDHNLHITYLHYFEQQMRAGEFYPRWISGLNFSAGSPIFFVQYPLPFFVGSALHWAFHLPATAGGEAHALGLFIFLMGFVAGLSSWLWCRTFSNPAVATVGAVAYMTLPYLYSCDIYFRGAIGEYSALAWLPLLLFFAHQIGDQPRRRIAGMAFAFALVVLSHLFTAVLFTPFLIVYVLLTSPRPRIFQNLLNMSAALALGLGVSGFYFLPMNAHRAFFSVTNLIKVGPDVFFYRDHLFPFSNTLFPTARLSLQVIGELSAIAAIGICALFALRLRRSQDSKVISVTVAVILISTCTAPLWHRIGLSPHPELAISRVADVRARIFLITFLTFEGALLAYAALRQRVGALAKFFLIASVACCFLETRWSEWIWSQSSLLWNIQFPWRLSGVLSVSAVGLFVLSLKDAWDRGSVRSQWLVGGVWLTIAGLSYLALDIPSNLMHRSTELKQKVESAYPAYARISRMPTPEELGPNDGLATGAALSAGDGTARLITITARHLRLEANCVQACRVLLRLVYYPFWQARESSRVSPLRASERAGLTECVLSAGVHNVDLELPIGPSEVLGNWLSLVSIMALIFLIWTSQRRKFAPSPRRNIDSVSSARAWLRRST